MTRSRLRRPTSKSTTTTFSPPRARAAPSAAAEVVLPTPPLPDVTTITLPIYLSCCGPSSVSAQNCRPQRVALQPGLHRPPPEVRLHVLRRQVEPVDGHQFGLQPAAEDARGAVAVRTGERPPPERPIDVDRSACDDFSPGCHGSDDGDVSLGEEH